MKSKIAMLVAPLLLSCVTSNQTEEDALVSSAETKSKVKLEVIGVPLLMGGHGTKIPIDENASLTAYHVAKYSWYKVLWKDEKCDLAIVEDKNDKNHIVKFVHAKLGDEVYTYGYGGVTMTPYKSKGKFVENYYKSETNNCVVTSTTATVMSGMSGGLVANKNGDGVAVILMIQHLFYKDYVTMTVVPEIMLSGEYKKYIK